MLADLIAARGVPATVVAADRSGGGFLDEIPGVKVINNYVRPTIFGHRIIILSEAIYRIWSLILAIFVGAGYESFYINTIMPGYAAFAGRFGAATCRPAAARLSGRLARPQAGDAGGCRGDARGVRSEGR